MLLKTMPTNIHEVMVSSSSQKLSHGLYLTGIALECRSFPQEMTEQNIKFLVIVSGHIKKKEKVCELAMQGMTMEIFLNKNKKYISVLQAPQSRGRNNSRRENDIMRRQQTCMQYVCYSIWLIYLRNQHLSVCNALQLSI